MNTQKTEQDLTGHCGYMSIDDIMMRELLPDLTIDECDTQGNIRNRGICTSLRDKLLLPASYTILAIFFEFYKFSWSLLIESPELPDAHAFPGCDLPRIDPIYCYTYYPPEEDGAPTPTVHLVEITVHARRTVPVTGGLDHLLHAPRSPDDTHTITLPGEPARTNEEAMHNGKLDAHAYYCVDFCMLLDETVGVAITGKEDGVRLTPAQFLTLMDWGKFHRKKLEQFAKEATE